MQPVRRLRDGAMRWALFQEPDRPRTRHLVVVEDHDASLLQRICQGWIGEGRARTPRLSRESPRA
jgi:hypothetical protein